MGKRNLQQTKCRETPDSSAQAGSLALLEADLRRG